MVCGGREQQSEWENPALPLGPFHSVSHPALGIPGPREGRDKEIDCNAEGIAPGWGAWTQCREVPYMELGSLSFLPPP